MTRKSAKKCLCTFFIISFFFSGYAQTGKANWSLNFGYDGYSFPGSWVPLFLTLKNPIPGGSLEIVRGDNGQNQNRESWDLTRSGLFEFPVYIDEKVPSFTVKIYSSGMLLAEQTFHPTDRLFSGHAILVGDVPATVRLSLSRMLYPEEPVLALPIPTQNLPVSALSYDAVTALVLSDPGPVLNEAQVTAMGEWLALGGKIILMDPLKDESSMLSQFGAQFALTGTGEERQLGLGRIRLLSAETLGEKKLADAVFWKEELSIQPISKTLRLRPGLVYGKRFDVFLNTTAENPLSALVTYIIVFWIIALSGCGVFLRKRRLSAGIAIICLLSIFILFQKNKITEAWDRGISMHIRELRLAQDCGTLASISLYTQDANSVSVFSRKSSPFTADYSFISPGSLDSGKIRFSPAPSLSWSHSTSSAGMFFDSADRRTVRLTGFFPTITSDSRDRKVLAKLRLVDGNAEWQIPGDNGSWKKSSAPPGEIMHDVDWILHVSEAAGDLGWTVGTDRVAGNSFGGMKWPPVKSIWLMGESRQANK